MFIVIYSQIFPKKEKIKTLSGIEWNRGCPMVWSHFDFAEFSQFNHFLPKTGQNHEKLTFSSKKWQKSKIFGNFGAENWSYF